MTKIQFLDELRKRLSFLPEEEAEEKVSFFAEMIDDRIEEGIDEEAAVNEISATNNYTSLSFPKVTEKATVSLKANRINIVTVIVLIFVSPILISLLASLFAIEISLIASMWSVIVSIWAVFVSCAAAVGVGIVCGIAYVFEGAVFGLLLISLSICAIGLALYLYFASLVLTKLGAKATVATYKLTVKFFRYTMKGLIK